MTVINSRLTGAALAILLAGTVCGVAVAAEDDGDLVTITPRKDQAEADAAAAAKAAEAEKSEKSLIGPIHGQVGAMIGTGGARAFYGTVDIPIGENGMMSLSYGEGRNLPYYDQYPGYGSYDRRYGWMDPYGTGWTGRAIRRD